MLVLTRSAQEEIRIGDDIIVRVLDVKGDRVRIGVAAPSEIPVHRQEVYQEIEATNRAALNVAGSGLKGAHELLGKQQRGPKRPSGSKQPKKRNSRRAKVSTEVTHGT